MIQTNWVFKKILKTLIKEGTWAITEIKEKIADNTNLAFKADPNTKVTDIENKIPDTSNFIDTQEFNKLTKTNFRQERKKQ